VPQKDHDVEPRQRRAPGADGELSLDLSKLQLDAGAVKTLTQQLDSLSADQQTDQLQRLERSVLRLERVNVQTLGMLKKLVSAVKKVPSETGK
jgi:hypothetical protein